jgi:glycosyltransferase involved in cell wall biosynthesis
MTFGKLVIAPNHGACPEYLGNAGNLLYDASSPKSLAIAMLKATQADMKTVKKIILHSVLPLCGIKLYNLALTH